MKIIDIYQIETLNYTKVRFEPPRPKRNIPQCGKCQRYGHTQAYCYHSPRCVKCAGNHSTKLCPHKEKSEHVKCVLCNSNHPANYKGCIVYKEIKKRTFPPLRNKLDGKPFAVNPNHTPDLAHHTLQRSHHNNSSTRLPPRRSNKYPPNNSKPTHNQVKYTN